MSNKLKPIDYHDMTGLNELRDKVAHLTDINDHTEAIKVIAQYFKLTACVTILKMIQVDHDEHGYLTDRMGTIRHAVTEIVYSHIRETYGYNVLEVLL